MQSKSFHLPVASHTPPPIPPSRLPRVLCVDDDPTMLEVLKRQLGKHYEVLTSCDVHGGVDALHTKGPFAAIVCDWRLPDGDGLKLLGQVHEEAPETGCILLSGHAETESLRAALAKAGVQRFLHKPYPVEALLDAVESSVTHFRSARGDARLIERMRHAALDALAHALAIANPEAFGRAQRIGRRAAAMLEIIGESRRCEIRTAPRPPGQRCGDGRACSIRCVNWIAETAAMITQLCTRPPAPHDEHAADGKAHAGPAHPQPAHPQPIRGPLSTAQPARAPLAAPGQPPVDEVELSRQEGAAAADHLLATIPDTDEIREIIRYQRKRFDGSGVPADGRFGDQLPIGARALHVATDIEALESTGLSAADALSILLDRRGQYDPALLEAFGRALGGQQRHEVHEMSVAMLRPGLTLVDDLRTRNGLLIVARGTELTFGLLDRVHEFQKTRGVREPVKVREALL